MGSGHFLVSLVDWLPDEVLGAMAEAVALVPWVAYVSPLAERIEAVRAEILPRRPRRSMKSAPPFSCPEQRSTSETLMHDSLSPAGLIVTCYLTKIPANGRRSTVNSCAGGPSGPAANADITTSYAGVRTR
jgi:hypothetical protein